jgi:LPS-assembly lipoprotein
MWNRLSLVPFLLLLTACGFHLRGHDIKDEGFAFHSIYIRAPAETPLITSLRRELAFNKLTVTQSPEKADLVLDIVSENTDKQILALSGSGQVLEYMLHYDVSLRAYDNQQREWMSAGKIMLQRYFPYDNTQILAKEQEEKLLYRNMRLDAVQLILRRLSFARPPQQPDDEVNQ